jgi:hypothetical protein
VKEFRCFSSTFSLHFFKTLPTAKMFVQSKHCGLSSININMCESKRQIFCVVFSSFMFIYTPFSTRNTLIVFTRTSFIICIFPLVGIQKFISVRVSSSKTFSVFLNFITFTTFNDYRKWFCTRELTPNQHSSTVQQYCSRMQRKRRVGNVCAVARNVNCWDSAGREMPVTVLPNV